MNYKNPLTLALYARGQHFIDKRLRMEGDTSQSREITKLWPLLSEYPVRHVVEVGANDGFTLSNSYPLIIRGWSAVLFEPSPSPLFLLENRWRANPAVAVIGKAVSNMSGEATLRIDVQGIEGQNLFSTIEQEDNWFTDRFIGDQTVTVQTTELSFELERLNVPRDFGLLSVDAEGHDLQVLESLGEYRPAFIICERNIVDLKTSFKKQQLLTKLEYLMVGRVGCNEIYVDSNSTFIQQRIRLIDPL
jgi:FkbM family methyltransferase